MMNESKSGDHSDKKERSGAAERQCNVRIRPVAATDGRRAKADLKEGMNGVSMQAAAAATRQAAEGKAGQAVGRRSRANAHARTERTDRRNESKGMLTV